MCLTSYIIYIFSWKRIFCKAYVSIVEVVVLIVNIDRHIFACFTFASLWVWGADVFALGANVDVKTGQKHFDLFGLTCYSNLHTDTPC